MVSSMLFDFSYTNIKVFYIAGLKQLGWLIGRNETDWTSSSAEKTSTRRPVTTETSKKGDSPSRATTRRTTRSTTTAPPATTNKSQLLGVIDMVQGIVASAQDGDEPGEKTPEKNKNKN